MIVRLKHPDHGVKYVYHQGELDSDMRNGWTVDEESTEKPVDTDEVIDDDTIELYRLKFGKKPHHRMKLDTILAEINADSE